MQGKRVYLDAEGRISMTDLEPGNYFFRPSWTERPSSSQAVHRSYSTGNTMDQIPPEKLDELERLASILSEPGKPTWFKFLDLLSAFGELEASFVSACDPNTIKALIAAARERDAAIRGAEAAEIGEKSANALLDTSITDGQRQVQRIRELEADLKARNPSGFSTTL